MNILKDTTVNSFLKVMELAYDFNSVDHPAERLSIRLGDNLIYGKDGNGAIVNNLDPNVVALLSAVAVDEKPPLELALENEVLFNQPVSVQIDGFTVLSYCDGVYNEKLLLEQVYEDEKLREAFTTVKDKASFAVSLSSTSVLVKEVVVFPTVGEFEKIVPQEEVVINNTYLVVSDTQSGVQAGATQNQTSFY